MSGDYGLGRRHAPDPRDAQFLLAAPPVAPTVTYRYWYDRWWNGNQGAQPFCVGYAWAHFIEDSPVPHPAKGPYIDPVEIYHDAQQVDEWPGTNYDGTSVRAGAKVLRSQGLIEEYRWAFDADTVAANVLTRGPVVMGTNWYDAMFTPDAAGRLHLDGALVGGHAYVLNGYNTRTRLFRVKNSWGIEWGVGGHAHLHHDDLQRLLVEDGEACMATETSVR